MALGCDGSVEYLAPKPEGMGRRVCGVWMRRMGDWVRYVCTWHELCWPFRRCIPTWVGGGHFGTCSEGQRDSWQWSHRASHAAGRHACHPHTTESSPGPRGFLGQPVRFALLYGRDLQALHRRTRQHRWMTTGICSRYYTLTQHGYQLQQAGSRRHSNCP